jgi:hypothetical protein
MMKSLFLMVAALLYANYAYSMPIATSDVVKIAAPEVNRIFGDDREDTFVNDGLLREAIIGFIGMADEPRELSDGSTMMTGCRPHSCPEKGAVIVDGHANQLRAAAILHFHCRRKLLETEASNQVPGNRCDTEPTLEIFIVRRSDALSGLKHELIYVRELEAWGKGSRYGNEVIRIKDVPPAR